MLTQERKKASMDTMPTTLSRNTSSAVEEQHSVARTLVLDLLPGALILAFFVAVLCIHIVADSRNLRSRFKLADLESQGCHQRRSLRSMAPERKQPLHVGDDILSC